jgi:hypothetical protein
VCPREQRDVEPGSERTIAGRLDTALALDAKCDNVLDALFFQFDGKTGVGLERVT